jgi:hypothetical protein
MVSRRRSRRTHPAAVVVLLLLVLVVLDAAADATLLLVVGAVFAAGWLARGRFRPPAPAPARPVLRVADDRDRLAAELDDARRQVAKLEQDAAEHDELLGRLERVTRRPVELHVADLERAQRLYGPAATGQTGRRP